MEKGKFMGMKAGQDMTESSRLNGLTGSVLYLGFSLLALPAIGAMYDETWRKLKS